MLPQPVGACHLCGWRPCLITCNFIAKIATPLSFCLAETLLGSLARAPSVVGRNRSTTAFIDGPKPDAGSAFSKNYAWELMSSDPLWMPQSFEPTKTRRAEKGDPKKCSGAFSRRFFNENSRRHNDAR